MIVRLILLFIVVALLLWVIRRMFGKNSFTEEIEHKETGLAHDAEATPGYRVMSEFIKTGTRAAIWLSTRI